MKVYLAQINPIVGDLRGNAAKILKTASYAYKNSSDFFTFYDFLHLKMPENHFKSFDICYLCPYMHKY